MLVGHRAGVVVVHDWVVGVWTREGSLRVPTETFEDGKGRTEDEETTLSILGYQRSPGCTYLPSRGTPVYCPSVGRRESLENGTRLVTEPEVVGTDTLPPWWTPELVRPSRGRSSLNLGSHLLLPVFLPQCGVNSREHFLQV